VPAESRTCPICTTPIPSTSQRRYCSPACKTAAWRRDNPHRNTRKAPPQPPPTTTGQQPAALRDCPHCGKPVTIIALLTTPQIAGPQLTAGTPETVPQRSAPTL
jgi:endogenous inhibitor of DNA gyrase (YacG/DUF329 family)